MTPEFEALTRFFVKLNSSGIPYMVGGSLASSAHGHPRQTNDADIVLTLDAPQSHLFAKLFEDEFMVSRQSIASALAAKEEYSSFQIIHNDSFVRVDCFIRGTDDFSINEFSRRQDTALLPGVTAPVATAEDIVLRKLLWYEMGGKVSDRQWIDVVGVLDVQKGHIDEAYLDTWATRLGVKQMLDDARSQVAD